MKRRRAKADMEGDEDESTSKTAHSNSEDPFYYPYCESDVTLVVEDKKLHVHKAVLSLHSPVFGAMFTEDFAEKDAKVIELPGNTYDAMLQFLLQMYPRHSFKAIKDDDVLSKVLPLAEEYQSQHVRDKCEAYISQQLRDSPFFTADRKLLYLLMCEKYSLTNHSEMVLESCAQVQVKDIEKSEHFKKLSPTWQVTLLKKRCHFVERYCPY